jgi:sugar/nucleoside kinase (ribokinase family)
VSHFARLGLPFPKSLLGFMPPDETHDDRKKIPPDAPRPGDIPHDYLEAAAAHICPLDFTSAIRLTSAFREAGIATLTLDPSPAYLSPAVIKDVRVLLQGLTAFLPSEEELRALFWGRTSDLWEMAEAVASFGSEFVIVKRGALGQMLYDSSVRKRWEIPAYPARLVDLNGAGHAFCGGFVAGYNQTFDPLRATLQGNVSASLTVEGSGAFHALDAMPGLAQKRLESLVPLVRQV